MKQFIIVLLMCITLGVNAQVDSTLVINSDVERLVDKYSAKIEASIVSLAETLKQPAEFVYTIMVKQQYVKSGIWLLLFILSVILTTIGIALLMGYEKSKNEEKLVIGIIMAIAFGLVFFISICHMKIIATGLFNPDYGAIKDIADLFK